MKAHIHLRGGMVGLLGFCLLILLTSGAASVQAQKRQMYRYINDEGHHVVAYQVPPEFVANGYDILSPTGALIETVPRTLDESERQGADSAAQRARDEAREVERIRKWDESLLLRYSTIEDIEAARDRELRDLRIRVSILKGKLRSLKQQVENYQAIAADQERLGREVDVEHLKAIDDLQSEIASTERAVADRQSEIAAVEADYERDMQRFAQLLDIVQMRKELSTNGREGS